jgi:hypothetical protein
MTKKITFLFFLVITTIGSFAQDNWDSVAYNGLIDGNSFRDIESFNGRLYATGINSDLTSPMLFSSVSGDFGTWVDETSLLSSLPFGLNKVSKLSMYSPTKMFLGTGNNYNSDTLQVYTTDGATLQQHGHLPITYLVDDYNAGVVDFAYFSATGAPDSVFAFVCNDGRIEVFKTSATAANPTWIEVYHSAYPTNRVYDAVVFNNELYAATNGDANGGFIIHSADGMVWDTLAYGGSGNSQNTAFTALEIYNNELYAGTQNTTTGGGRLFKSTNGVTWTPVSLTALGYGSGLNQITDMKTLNGRLFMTCKYFNGSYNFVKVFYTNDGNTFNNTDIGSGMSNDLYQDPASYRLETFNGDVYNAGSNTNYGQIWRLIMPVASYSFASTNICAGGTVTFTNTSANSTVFDWSENNGPVVSTATDYSPLYSTPATIDVKLRAYGGNIYDSSVVTFYIHPQVTGSLNAVPTNSVCPGEPTTLTYTPTGGAPPYTYSWTSGGGFPAQPNVPSFTFNPVNGGSYSLLVTDVNGCTYFDMHSVGMSAPITAISGTVSYSGGPVTNGNVYLLKYQPTYAGTDTVATLPIAANGSFIHSNGLYGQYLLKADPDITVAALANTISTYNGGFFRWDSASPFLHTCAAASTVNIQVLELPLQNGTATISGYLTEGDGFGQRLMNPQNNPFFVPGGPLKGIDVKLGKNPGGGIQARTMSDTSSTSVGRFEFVNVPVGDYRIYVDIPNMPMDSLREVSVTPGTDSIPDNNYIADSVSIFVENLIGIKNNEQASASHIKVFPNPAKDNFHIEYEVLKKSEVRLSVYDVVGKQISSETTVQQGIQKKQVDAGSWPAGVYFIRLELNGTVETMRVIVSR